MSDTLLQAHLDYVRENAPYYKERVVRSGKLEDFPLMKRRVLMDNYAGLITDPEVRGGPVPGLLRGGATQAPDRNAGEFNVSRNLVIEQTSGTSGIPARFVKTREERNAISIAIWRCRRSIDPRVNFGNFQPLFHLPAGAALPVNPYEVYPHSIREFYEWLRLQSSRWLHMPPALLGRHLAGLRHLGLKAPVPELKFIETSGAPLNGRLIGLAREVLEAAVVNQYGTREVWAIGYATEAAAFAPLTESVHIELVDAEGRPIESPGLEGSVVVTSKILKLLPIIRYVTGDRGSWVQSERGRLLALSSDREANMLSLNGKTISGGEFFKTVLGNVYSSIGYVELDYLQIRKTGASDFTVDISGAANEAVFDGLSYLFKRIDPESRFTRNHIQNPAEILSNPNRKSYLFVNQYAG